MAKVEKLIGIYTGAALNTPATNVLRMPSITGTVTGVYFDASEATDGPLELGVYEDGVLVSLITVADTTANEDVTGLSFSSTLGKVISLDLLSPIPTAAPAPPWSLIVTVEVTETHVALTGDQTVAGVKTFSSDPIIPDEAYGVGWNGSLEPPTKNAVYDKIETIGGSVPFTAASGSGAAYLDFAEDTDNGTNRVRLQGAASTADVTVTLPAATDTLVGKDTTDTLTNKTLTAPVMTAPVLGTPASGTLTNCTGLPTTGLVDDAVTLAKIANAAANSKLLGSGDAGSGANYVEITLGTNLSMTGTTLSASLAGGAVDTANSPNAGEWAKFTDADTIEGRTNAELKADLDLEIGVDLQAYDADLTTWAGITPGANVGTFLATPSSANLLAALTDETGTGAAVFGTAPTINNPKIDLDASNASDDTYSGIQLSGRVAASGGLTQWDCCYINTSSEIALADANGSGTYPAIGLAAGTVSGAAAAIVITHGPVRNDAWSWTVGGVIYLSATAGGLTQTAPSTSGDKVQVIGVAISADEMFVNPSLDYLTIT